MKQHALLYLHSQDEHITSIWFYAPDVEEHHEEMLDQMEAEYYGWVE